MFQSGTAYSTIRSYISGLSFFLKLNDYDDLTKKFVIGKLLDGAKRIRGKSNDSRLPITKPLLNNIIRVLPYICSSKFEVKLFQAAFLVAFYGFMRVGEIAVKSSNSRHTILFNNVRILEETIEIFLASSKTDQYGKGIYIVIPKQAELCPLQAMKIYLESRPSVEGVFFCHFDTTPLTCYQFTTILKKTLKLLKVNHENILSHSFRIGMATHCSMEGMSDEDIKSLGRWKSNVFKNYIRIPSCN